MAAAADAEMTVVEVKGRTTVRLHTAATQSMALLEDPALVHEVTSEALRIALAEKLGGFQGVTISRAPVGDATAPATATVDFEELSACIRRLVGAYDALSEKLEEVKAPLERLAGHADSLPNDECKEAVKSIRGVLETAVSLQDSAEADARAAGEDASERRKVADAVEAKRKADLRAAVRRRMLDANSDSDASDAGAGASSDDEGVSADTRHVDPERSGYKPLLGSDDDDDDDDAEDGATGAAQPPPLERDPDLYE